MEIKLHEIQIRDLIDQFVDDEEEGVFGFHGKLNIRPKYQREFTYNPKQQAAVINSILHSYPINTMYWMVNEDGTYELLDGQQRTMSICSYAIKNDFSIKVITGVGENDIYFGSLTEDLREKFLNYKILVYFCSGTDTERLEWFQVINTAGKTLNSQEIRNAVYAGTWLTDAKKYFSKTNCAAYNLGSKYIIGNANEQAYLEKVLSWLADKENVSIENYMAQHQHDESSVNERMYFENVISWVSNLFKVYRKEMKGVEWGILYNQYHDDTSFTPVQLEEEVKELMENDEITNKKGIYTYVFDKKEKNLSLRTFSDIQKRVAYEKQDGICPCCGNHFKIEEMQGDHIIPWSKGGKTIQENCQMLCGQCNSKKSNH